MHFQMLITIEMPLDADSETVRKSVYEALVNDESFCGEGGRFGCPLADWFVIGGRWSGLLAEALIGNAFRRALQATFPELKDGELIPAWAEAHPAEMNALWASCGGKGIHPWNRSSYDEHGYEDDAMPLTQALYDALLAQYKGSATEQDGGHCEYADLEHEQLCPDFIGSKWLVVVDYHS